MYITRKQEKEIINHMLQKLIEPILELVDLFECDWNQEHFVEDEVPKAEKNVFLECFNNLGETKIFILHYDANYDWWFDDKGNPLMYWEPVRWVYVP